MLPLKTPVKSILISSSSGGPKNSLAGGSITQSLLTSSQGHHPSVSESLCLHVALFLCPNFPLLIRSPVIPDEGLLQRPYLSIVKPTKTLSSNNVTFKSTWGSDFNLPFYGGQNSSPSSLTRLNLRFEQVKTLIWKLWERIRFQIH